MARRSMGSLVAITALLALAVLPGGTQAQASNSIHLELDGGPEAGTYDLTTHEPCREGDQGVPGQWSLYIDETGAMPSRVSFSFSIETEWNQLSATFGDSAAGGAWYRTDFIDQGRATIDDRGDDVTLQLAVDRVHVYDTALGQDIDVPGRVTVQCRIIERRNPVPSYAGPLTPPEPGTWTGTITLAAVTDHQESDQGASDDPDSTYYETWVSEESVQEDVVDTLAIDAVDPADVSRGIRRVRLGGTATSEGSTLQRAVTTWQKRNSGCTWTEELRHETEGSWSGTGTVDGELVFESDGAYQLLLYPAWGETPEFPLRSTLTISDLSANCEGEGYQGDVPGGPRTPFASWLLQEYDVTGVLPQLTGRLDPNDPGAVVAGAGSWEISDPEDTTLSAEWELVHDGPIDLPDN